MNSRPTSLTLRQRALLISSAAALYAVNFWPSRQVTKAGLIALGRPQYVGFKGVFLPHLLLYSTLTAVSPLCCGSCSCGRACCRHRG